MRKQIGCEVGNYDVKLMVRDKSVIDLLEAKGHKALDGEGIATLSIINVLSPGKDRRALGTTSALINLLDVEIETSLAEASGRWFVGGLAMKEGEKVFKPTRETEKSSNPHTIVMLLTTTAYALFDPKRPEKKEQVSLGSLLPTEEYFIDGNLEKFTEKLVGKHVIKFNDPAFKGGKIILEIADDVEILPEGTAGQIATTYDWNGEPFDPDYDKKVIMNIDIGSIDTDVSIMDEGEFKSKGFFGIKGGTTTVLRELADYIKSQYKTSVDTHKIDYHVRTKTPLRIGASVEVGELIEKAEKFYLQDAQLLSDSLSELLRDRNIEKGTINEVNLIGGGPEFYEAGFKKYFETKHMTITVPKNARFKNVEGVLKSLIFKLNETHSPESEIYKEAN